MPTTTCKKTTAAWNSGKAATTAKNTKVAIEGEHLTLRLHGNLIAAKPLAGGPTLFSMAGWGTPTTRRYLNSVGIHLSQRDYQQVYGGTPINTHKWYDEKGNETARPL